MHPSAMENGRLFFDTYLKDARDLTIIEIGSQDVNGSLRSVAPKNNKYIGLDFAEGRGVDIILQDAYRLPFEDNSIDVCVSSSCFEHAEFFWLTFNEIIRVLKPDGLFYLNAPSTGDVHNYPVDCWRFYPDSGSAMKNWANRNGYNVTVLESYTDKHSTCQWKDYVAVFVKDATCYQKYPNRIK